MSQGLICAAGTNSQRALGVEDDPDIFFHDIMTKTRGLADPGLARTIANGAGPCIDWLAEDFDVPLGLDTGFLPAYGHSRMRVHGWRGHGGSDLLQALHARLETQGVDLLLGARLVDIVDDGAGRALGVVIERPDGARERIGCDALVLATCGFAGNPDLVKAHMPEMAQARYHGHEGNRGDGLMLGARLGGALADMGSYQGFGMLADPHGVTLPPGVMFRGGVLLNAQGRRFVNEIDDIAGMVHPVLAQPGGAVWVVYDGPIADALADIPDWRQLAALNAPRTAATLAALSRIIGCDPRRIGAALRDAREASRTGGADSLGRRWPDARPPQPPFFAVKVTGALYHTQGGLQVDGDARVVRSDGSTLPNVFAGGGAARGVSGPSSWGYLPAMGLCAAVTLGRLAGQSAARMVEGKRPR